MKFHVTFEVDEVDAPGQKTTTAAKRRELIADIKFNFPGAKAIEVTLAKGKPSTARVPREPK